MDRQGAAQVALSACPCIFFFSSRRRHTRLQGDWSSDVCSSDLFILGAWLAWRAAGDEGASGILRMPLLAALFFFLALLSKETALAFLVGPRSGERRGGEECRSRWSPYHLKKKKKQIGVCLVVE